MAILYLLLLLAAFLCFIAAAFMAERPWTARVNLVALGLALWVAVDLIHAIKAA